MIRVGSGGRPQGLPVTAEDLRIRVHCNGGANDGQQHGRSYDQGDAVRFLRWWAEPDLLVT
jgi:hypothetical protein